MYGLLIESIAFHLQEQYGEEKWNQVKDMIGMRNVVFSSHKVYSEDLIERIALSCSNLFGKSPEEFKKFFGRCFVKFFGRYGYEPLIRASGRYFRDFVHGIDDLHNQIRFGFPGMVSPFFHVENEDRHGMVVHYRSKRKGYTYYVIGQLTEIAESVYNLNLHVDVDGLPKYDPDTQITLIVLNLKFDNSDHMKRLAVKNKIAKSVHLPNISSSYIFKVIPFAVVFNKQMVITSAGRRFNDMFGGIHHVMNRKISDLLVLRRPKVNFTFDQVILLQESCFELQSAFAVRRMKAMTEYTRGVDPTANEYLLLKGEMKLLDGQNSIIFMSAPLLPDIDTMVNLGLCFEDLSKYGFSRNIVTARMQHGAVLENMYDKLLKQTKELDENLHKLEIWKSKGDQLLHSMIPESFATRLNNGENPSSLSENYDDVTVLFAEVTDYCEMNNEVSPSELVRGINSIFKAFDKILDGHSVFKVETVVSAVYLLISGAPKPCREHANSVADVALEMIRETKAHPVKIGNSKVQTRIGIHSGPVATGVVGLKNLHYCIFGDTVNTASRMLSLSSPGKILISKACRNKLTHFITKKHQVCNVKGKGEMVTFWVTGRTADAKE